MRASELMPPDSSDDRQRRAVATLTAAALFFWSTRGSDGGFLSAVAKTVAMIYETLDALED
jgi:hypothetical protein